MLLQARALKAEKHRAQKEKAKEKGAAATDTTSHPPAKPAAPPAVAAPEPAACARVKTLAEIKAEKEAAAAAAAAAATGGAKAAAAKPAAVSAEAASGGALQKAVATGTKPPTQSPRTKAQPQPRAAVAAQQTALPPSTAAAVTTAIGTPTAPPVMVRVKSLLELKAEMAAAVPLAADANAPNLTPPSALKRQLSAEEVNRVLR